MLTPSRVKVMVVVNCFAWRLQLPLLLIGCSRIVRMRTVFSSPGDVSAVTMVICSFVLFCCPARHLVLSNSRIAQCMTCHCDRDCDRDCNCFESTYLLPLAMI